MSPISPVVTLIVVGVLLWLVNTYRPMDGKIKSILNVVVVNCVIAWLIHAFGGAALEKFGFRGSDESKTT